VAARPIWRSQSISSAAEAAAIHIVIGENRDPARCAPGSRGGGGFHVLQTAGIGQQVAQDLGSRKMQASASDA
jgi:hypothetical protein